MTLIDVRSPQEYASGHIPSAVNIPLFTDEERKEVGICYKEKGAQEALLLGLSYTGPRLSQLIKSALLLPFPLEVYCARGGMRSQSVLWLFKLAKLPVTCRIGGYKEWRRQCIALFSQKWKLQIIGGMTGCGKTQHLQELKKQGRAILDLEELACHRGSLFGALQNQRQPTQEQFENKMAAALLNISDRETIYVEDESRFIGSCKIPDPFFCQMQKASITIIEKPMDERLLRLIDDYGALPKESLIASFQNLKKRLGLERVQKAIRLIDEGDLKSACTIALDYYDKCYHSSIKKRGCL